MSGHRFPVAGALYLELETGLRLRVANVQALVFEPELPDQVVDVSLRAGLEGLPALEVTPAAEDRDWAAAAIVLEPAPAPPPVPRGGRATVTVPKLNQPARPPRSARQVLQERSPSDGPSRGVARRLQPGRKPCGKCHELNPPRCSSCQSCGAPFPAKAKS